MSGGALISVAFDGGLAILLVATMSYCSKLSKRIKTLQDTRSELAGMIKKFEDATGRAMASVTDLQTVSKKIAEALQLKIDKANFLADDLAFLIEKSNKLIVQLDQARIAHKTNESRPVPKVVVQPRPASLPPVIKSKQSLDEILQVMASSPESRETDRLDKHGNVTGEKLVPRTSAERELMTALKIVK